MKVTQVAIRPTPASESAGRPSLTPELLAASGARYSRNNEGLESILSKIDPNNLDKSVDGIFRMIDYGHQSIADMAPVAMFMDGVSIWLAYQVWALCPTAGGQESSTRYINYSSAEALNAADFGIPDALREDWSTQLRACLAAYESALKIWENIAEQNPELMRLPKSLLEDPSEKAQKQVARMQRNYAFDRARNFLPVAAPTNMMMIMSARGWVNLCQHLLSHPLPEAQRLGELIREELPLAAPRLLKHAQAKSSIQNGWNREFENWKYLAQQTEYSDGEHSPRAELEVFAPRGIAETDFASDLEFHDNRYAYTGEMLKRTAIRFSWEAIALAEIRDLNRHRTGTKYCPLVPRGFYAALDQLSAENSELQKLSSQASQLSNQARELLQNGDASFIYWTSLGTQYFFEHTTTADKFIYEAELRTGTGAHFRYAKHLHDALALWFEKFPETRGLILEGSAEPE